MISSNKWTPYLCYGIVIDEFTSTDDAVLSLKQGEHVVIVERINNWYRGYSAFGKKFLGIFPANIIEIINNASITPIMGLSWEKLDQFSLDQAEITMISLEITKVLKDWYNALSGLLLKSDYVMFQKLLDLFYDLVDKKNGLMSNYKTVAQKHLLKKEIMVIIDEGNKCVSNDGFVRENGLMLRNSRIMQLYKAHCQRFYLTDQVPTVPLKDVGSKFQLLIQFKGLTDVDLRNFQVQIGIWNGRSEALYQPLILKNSGAIVFTDIYKKEIFTESLFLMLKVSQVEKGVQRPFGTGSLDLSKRLKHYNAGDNPGLDEFSVAISVPTNDTDHQKYFDSTNHSNYLKNFFAKMALSVFYGEIDQAFQNYPLLFHSAAITRRFGSVCYYSESKNSLHVNLHSADLSNQKKIWSIKNVQVQVEVKSFSGESQSCIFDGTFDVLHSSIRSVVFSNNDSPSWDMHFRIDLDPLIMLKSHLVVTVGSVDEKSEFRPLSFAYLPLFYSQNEPVRDDCHLLSLYKFDYSFSMPSVYMTVPAGPSIFVPSGLSSLSIEELYNAAEYMAANNIKLKDTVRLSTKLDSSLLTKCLPLMMLLHWENVLRNHRGNIFSIIKDCYTIDESEKVKFSSQIVSSLLDIMDSDIEDINMEQLSADVVNFLVHVFSTIQNIQPQNSKSKLVDLCQSAQISKKISQRVLRAVQKLLDLSSSNSQLTRNQFNEFIKGWDLIFVIMFAPYNQETDHEVQLISSIIFKKLLEIIVNQNLRFSYDSQLLIAENFCGILKIWIPFHSMKRIFDYMSDFLIAAKKNVALQLAFMRIFISEDYIKDSSSEALAYELISNWIPLYLTGKWGGNNSLNEYTRVSVKVLAFTTTQKRQELSHLLDFLSEFLEIIYSAPKSGSSDRLADCLWILLETFCNYSDWKNMKRNSSRQTKIPIALEDSMSSSTGPASIALSDLASILISFFDILTDQSIINQFSKYLEIKGADECAVYVSQWLDAISSLMTNIYPNGWIAMLMTVKLVCLRSLTILSNFMCSEFSSYTGRISNIKTKNILNANKVDGYQLWRRCFRSILTLIHIHNSLKSDLSAQNEMITSMADCDILKQCCELIERNWNVLAKSDDYYEILKLLIPKFSAAFLEMSLSKEPSLQNTGINMLFSMIKLEFRVHGNFSRVEDQIFEQMPWIVEKSKTYSHDQDIILRFSNLFFDGHLHVDADTKFIEQGKKFVDFLDKFLSLASDINNLSDDIINIDEKAYATMKMIQFLSDLEKPEMLIVFIQSLYDLHLCQERYTEAGLLLKRYGDTLPWSTYSVEEIAGSDELDRPKFRDEIYKQCIDMLDQGQSWERALEICRDLSEFFQFELFDFKKLSEILSRQANITEKIRTQDRYFSNYYLVSFFGSGFKNNLHGKVFVYKGLLWEKLGSFCERILKRHPGSKLIKASPSDSESQENKKMILIRSLDAYLDLQMTPASRGSKPLPWPKINEDLHLNQQNGPATKNDFLNSPFENQVLHRIPEYVSYYFESNETNIFTFCRPIRKVISEEFRRLGKDAFEYLSNYSQQTVIYTKHRFPGLLSRSEVMSTHSFELSPIETAIITIKKKSRELSKYIKIFSALPNADSSSDSKAFGRDSIDASDKSRAASFSSHSGSNHFTMALNGAVDAPVNGGIPMFRSAFFSECYLSEAKHLGTESFVEDLRKAIDDQVIIMHRCLKVHSGVISSEMRPLHDQLIASFNKNFVEELSRINLRPLRQTSENMPLNWLARNSSDSSFNLKNSKFTNQSLLDIRKAGVSADIRYSSASDELRRFSDMKRHTALNLILLESSGWEVEDEDKTTIMHTRISVGNESSTASDTERIDQKSDGSSTKTKVNLAKKILKFIAPKIKSNSLKQ